MSINATESRRLRLAICAVGGMLVLGLAGAACGMRAISNASAEEAAQTPAVEAAPAADESSAAETDTRPQLTPSSATSQAISENQPISGNMTLPGGGAAAGAGTGGMPQLAATSEGSRANLEGLQDLSYLGDAASQASTTAGAASSAGSSSAPTQTASATEDITALVGESFSMDVDCTLCHTKEIDNMQIEGFTGYNHKDLTCIMCHDDGESLAAAHEEYSVRQATRVVALVNTTVDEELCFSCHGDREALIAATADSTVLVDENGTQVNPHDLPAGDQHASITCGSCHKMHNDLTTQQTAQNTCLTCHHANVYECNTCHVA